jgi:dipeptidyl aminopeptidase/acylaminoacyl peptidase
MRTIATSRIGALLLLVALVSLSLISPPARAAEPGLPANRIWVHTPGRITALASGGRSVPLPQAPVQPSVQVAPNGSLLAYAELSASGRFERLVGVTARTGARRVLHTAAGANILQPVFAPDSGTLAFSVVAGEGWQLKALDLRSGRVRVLRQGTLRARMLTPIAWTPAGLIANQILWASDAPAQGLFLVDGARGTVRALNDADHLTAVPSADGKRIAIVSGVDLPAGPGVATDMTISILNLDTGGARAIVVHSPVHLGSLAWAPDGSKLLYIATNSATRVRTLHVVNADGSGDQTLAFSPTGRQGELRDARWQGSGTMLVLAGGERSVQLYTAPSRGLKAAGLRQVGSFPGVSRQATAQIVYVPR